MGVRFNAGHAGPSGPFPSGDSSPSTEEARRHFDRGVALEADAEYESALAAYRRAIDTDPAFVEAHLAYQETKQALWRAYELAPEYRALRDRHPTSAVHQFLYAHSLGRTNANWETMAAEHGRAIDLDPSLPWPHAYRYSRYTFPDRENADEVLRGFQRCIDLAPALSDCHERRGDFLMLLSRPAEAAEAYHTAIRLQGPRNRVALNLKLTDSRMRAADTASGFEALDHARSDLDRIGGIGNMFRSWTLVYNYALGWRDLVSAEFSTRIERLRAEAEAQVELLVDRARNPHLESEWLINRASIALSQGADARGIGQFMAALDVLEPIGAPAREAHVERRLCEARRNLFQMEDARAHCRTAIEVFRALPDSVELSRTVHQLVHVEEDLGHLDEALAAAETYVALASRVGTENHLVSALHDLGWIAWRLGRWEEALGALERMAELAAAKGRWLYEVGEFYEAIGSYRLALDFYSRGVRDTTAFQPGAWGNYGRSLLGLSRVHLRLGDIPAALAAGLEYDRWVLSRGTGGAAFPNLGEIYRTSGQGVDAIAHASGWLRQAEREGNEAFAFDARRELALAHVAGGNAEEAIPHLRSLVSESAGGGRFWERGPELLALSEAYVAAARADSALHYATAAREHARWTRDPEQAWRAEHAAGRALELAGDPTAALVAHRQSIEILERTRGRAPSDEARTRFLSDRLAPFDAAIRLELGGVPGVDGADSSDRDARVERAPGLERAFELAEQKKARVLLDLLVAGRTVAPPSGGALLHARARQAALETRLTAARRELRARTAGSDSRSDELTRSEATVDSLWTEYANAVEAIELEAPLQAATSGHGSPIPVEHLRQVLKPREALLEYTFIDGQLAAFVITGQRLDVVTLATTVDRVRDQVRKLREPFEAYRRGDLSLAQMDWDLTTAGALYADLIAPLHPHLADIDRLLIVPEDVLWHLPFEALVARVPDSDVVVERPGRAVALFAEYDGVEFLIDRFAVSYSPSASVLNPRLWPAPRENTRALIMGDAGVDGGRPSYADGAGASGLPGGLAPLPGAAIEIEAIEHLFRDEGLAVEVAATEEDYRARGPGRRLIHFATHAVLNEASPLYSGLVLKAGASSDGHLQAHEIADLRLNADLVTLAACETGLGQIRGGEGVMSLSRAFLAAGVPSVVVGLWAIPDIEDERTLLMPDFYRRLLAGATKAEALREAKLALRGRSIEAPGGLVVSMAHPVFWAPLVLIGRAD